MAFRYSVNTNALKGMSYAKMAEMASRIGLDGIEWGLPGLDGMPGAAREMGQLARDNGLDIVSFLNAPHPWKTDLIKRYSEVVAAAGGKVLRVAHPWLAASLAESVHQRDSFVDLFSRTRDGLEGLLPVGRQFGVRYVLETHCGSVTASPAAGAWLMQGLDAACVGLIYDPAHGASEGSMRPRHAVEALGSYLAYVHAQSLRPKVSGDRLAGPERRGWVAEGCFLDEGFADFVEVSFALRAVGYDGFVSMEQFFRTNPEEQLKRGLAFLKACEAHAPSCPQEPYTTFND